MPGRLAHFIAAALIAGIVAGLLCRQLMPDTDDLARLANYMGIVTDLFLRLIKMIIAPLVFATLVGGIAQMGNSHMVGRVALRAMGWFITASLISLTLGLIMVNILHPGADLNLALPSSGAPVVQSNALNLKDFVTHIVPRSAVEAMAQNEILQIVVFSLFFGVALASLGRRGEPLIVMADALTHVMLTVTGYVMKAAPAAVFAAVTAVVAVQGPGILKTYGLFIGGFYLSLALLWVLLISAAFLVVGPRTGALIKAIRVPVLVAFSTASSEAAYPKTLEQLERFGASPRIASFILPLGYSFNLDGSMMYSTFATLFIAQAYGISLTWVEQITILLVLMITSKGIAGVPRASLVVVAATLGTFHIPEAGLLLILGIDQFLDMGRSATNVVGNSIAAVAVARWEGELKPAAAPDKTL